MRGRRGSAMSITHTDHCVGPTSASSQCFIMPWCRLPLCRRQVLSTTASLYWPVGPIAAFGRYYYTSRPTDFLSCGDMGVRVIHRSTDFYIVIKNESWGAYLTIIFDGDELRRFMGLYTAHTSHGGHPPGIGKPRKVREFTLVREKSGLPCLCCATASAIVTNVFFHDTVQSSSQNTAK